MQLARLLCVPPQYAGDCTRIEQCRDDIEQRSQAHRAVNVFQDRRVATVVVAIAEREIEYIAPDVLAQLAVEISEALGERDEHLVVFQRLSAFKRAGE